MKLGDLVKFVEHHQDGKTDRILGIVIDKMICHDEKSLFRIKWFNKKENDTWHINPIESEQAAKDLFIISEI